MDDAKEAGEGDSEDEMEDDFVAQLMEEGEGSSAEGDWSDEEGSDIGSDFGGGRSEKYEKVARIKDFLLKKKKSSEA